MTEQHICIYCFCLFFSHVTIPVLVLSSMKDLSC
uniref:Uncharacterized protein n=1 Tax=Arundo donax TaxID=35708 RepID=A0A0A9C4A0_ARUDO